MARPRPKPSSRELRESADQIRDIASACRERRDISEREARRLFNAARRSDWRAVRAERKGR